MAADQESAGADRSGDRRGPDRRGIERRAVERRAPPPVWRRPWALVSYGVVGALVVMLLAGGFGGEDEPAVPAVVDAPRASPAPQPSSPDAAARPPEAAFATADFERLVIEGQEAHGRTVRTELYCDTPTPVALRQSIPIAESAIVALRDSLGRVPAAACKWGGQGDERRQDFLLLVPPDLADDFAAAPVITDNFVRRRRLLAEVEWIGRSEVLALRTAGVLRRVLRR
ncbi:MAG TPA: hypothetical protein VGR37_20680 [Longimicrobiaceae bacterium]|nr:hypothetical protein [Longimicrobiaceae bacterium]